MVLQTLPLVHSTCVYILSRHIIMYTTSLHQVSSPSIYQWHWKVRRRGVKKTLCNSFCNESPEVRRCCWPMPANPGNGASLLLKEEYKSSKARHKHFTVSPARRICCRNLCGHDWIQHFMGFVYSTSTEFCELFWDFHLLSTESWSCCTGSLLRTNQIYLMHTFFITFIKIRQISRNSVISWIW